MRYGVLGYPILHSRSPEIFKILHNIFSVDLNYEILEIKPEEFIQKQKEILNQYDGLNITAPYKEKILEIADKKTSDVEFLRAANVIAKTQEGLLAANTDVFGFEQTIIEKAIPASWSVMILGSGGAARAVLLALVRQGFQKIGIVSRNHEKFLEIKKSFKEEFGFQHIQHLSSQEDQTNFSAQIVINCTSVGMGNFFSREDLRIFDLHFVPQIAYDLIYFPPDTIFMEMMREQGSQAINGLEMLIYQAIQTFEIWFPEKFQKSNYLNLKNEIYKELL